MKTETQTKTIYTIEEAWVNVQPKYLKELYSGYAFEHDSDIQTISEDFNDYDKAKKEFNKLTAKLGYDCYYRKYGLTEYALSRTVYDENDEEVSFDIIESKDATFVVYDENYKIIAKSDRMKDLIEYDIYDNVKVI